MHPKRCSLVMQAAVFGVGADVKAPDGKNKEAGRFAERMFANLLAAEMGASILKADHPLVLFNAAGGYVEWCDLLGDRRLPYDLITR